MHNHGHGFMNIAPVIRIANGDILLGIIRHWLKRHPIYGLEHARLHYLPLVRHNCSSGG